MDRTRKVKKSDLESALGRYRRFLVDLGFRESTIDMYVFRAGKYLEFSETEQPSAEDFIRFRKYFRIKVITIYPKSVWFLDQETS